jgi:hypothetical protein
MERNRALTGWIFGSGFDDSVLEENDSQQGKI